MKSNAEPTRSMRGYSLDCLLERIGSRPRPQAFWVIEGHELEKRPPLGHLDVRADRGESLPGRWVNSQDLSNGDVVFSPIGGQVAICRIQHSHEGVPVCNLTIRVLHTFSVGEVQSLVHKSTGSFGMPLMGNPALANLIRNIAGMPVNAAEKVRLLTKGASKISGITFTRLPDVPWAIAIFRGQTVPSGPMKGRSPVLAVLGDGSIVRGFDKPHPWGRPYNIIDKNELLPL